MNNLAFATSFAGLTIGKRPAKCPAQSLRASMGDSLAPVIKINDTKWDGTSSISVSMEKVEASQAAAVEVAGNGALGATLRRRSLPAGTEDTTPRGSPPEGVLPKDFFFPTSTRNEAPVISISPSSVSVSYEAIDPIVAGVSANSSDSVAFWKQAPVKYTAPESTGGGDEAEVISTAAFEAYFPTKIRNRAPEISMKRPKSADDPSDGFIEVGNVFVGLNADLAREVSVSAGEDSPAVAGSAVVAAKFPPERNGMAPVVVIEEKERVSFGMDEIPLPLGLAAEIMAKYSSADTIVDKAYPRDTRYLAPEITMDGEGEDMSISVRMAFIDEPSTEGVAVASK